MRFGFGNHDKRFFTAPARGSEHNHVAGAYAINIVHCAFNILGIHVAPTKDDDVFNTSAHDQLAVNEIPEIARAQPSVVKRGSGGIGPFVVPGGHRLTAHFKLTHFAILHHGTSRTINDTNL